MATRLSTVSIVMIAILCVGIARADDDQDIKRKGKKKAKQAAAIFEKIKSLPGDWIATKGEHKGHVALNVKVIAGGSAVVETDFPGSDHEMVTIYHLDVDDVMLNHYCMLGNQPRMKVKMGDERETLEFEFVAATNLASKNDPHVHEGRLKFIDADTLHSTWVLFEDNKAKEEHSFEMTRKK